MTCLLYTSEELAESWDEGVFAYQGYHFEAVGVLSLIHIYAYNKYYGNRDYLFDLNSIPTGSGGFGYTIPVSYTHLDVYKRQP